jgi:hypothetical protein
VRRKREKGDADSFKRTVSTGSGIRWVFFLGRPVWPALGPVVVLPVGVTPLIYQYGETVIIQRERQAREDEYGTLKLSIEAVVGRWRTPSVDSGSSQRCMALFSGPLPLKQGKQRKK